MPEKEIPLIGPTYQDGSKPVSNQVTENVYPEISLPNGKKPISFRSFPGLKSWATVGTGSDRGMFKMNDVLYKVTGTTLYSVDSSGTGTSLGTIPGSGRVIGDTNGLQLILCNGSNAYSYTTAGGLATISDSNLVNPNGVRFINRRFIYDSDGNESVLGKNTFAVSALDDGTTIDSTAFAESRPDPTIRPYTFAQNVYFFGTETIEPWWNSGTGSPPFDRINSAMQKLGVIGLGAVHSVDSNKDNVYFIGNDKQPYQMRSFDRQSIASPGLMNEWESYSDISDAYTNCIEINGQQIAVFSFPTAGKTWAYHEATGFWFNLSTGADRQRHPISNYIEIYGKKLVADYRNGNIYELDHDTYTNNGETVYRGRTTSPITSDTLQMGRNKEIEVSNLELICETGVGLLSGDGSEPNAGLKVSTDGGRTYTEMDPQSLGVLGDYDLDVIWPGLVSNSKQVQFEIYTTEPVKFSMAALYANVELNT